MGCCILFHPEDQPDVDGRRIERFSIPFGEQRIYICFDEINSGEFLNKFESDIANNTRLSYKTNLQKRHATIKTHTITLLLLLIVSVDS